MTLIYLQIYEKQKKLRDRELNPGLPRDRRGYSPLYYRGCAQCYSELTRLNKIMGGAFHLLAPHSSGI